MGTILNAYCENCGFEEKVWFGAGMLTHKTECNVPAIDNENGELVQKNIFERDKLKNNFTFYNEEKMFNGVIQNNNIHWGDIFLKETENICPRCTLFSMNFVKIGFFD